MKRFGYEIYQNTDGDIVIRQESGLSEMFIVVSEEEVELLCKDLLNFKNEMADGE